MAKIKLIAFDLDGVLVDGHGSWNEVHLGLGTIKHSEKNKAEYNLGRINFDEWARRDAELWRGVEISRIEEILNRVPLMNGASKTMDALRDKCRLVIISGGLQTLADRIRGELGMNHAVANELVVNKGKVCGITTKVGFDDKPWVLKKIASRYRVPLKQCAAVGDYLNDIPMFRVAGLSIAFNPYTDEVAENADEAVYEKNLARILEFF